MKNSFFAAIGITLKIGLRAWWTTASIILLAGSSIDPELLVFRSQKLGCRGGEENVPFGCYKTEIRHSDRVHEIAVYNQANFHCVGSEGDHVGKGTSCNRYNYQQLFCN